MKTLKQFIMEGDADFSSAERLAKDLTRKFNDSIGSYMMLYKGGLTAGPIGFGLWKDGLLETEIIIDLSQNKVYAMQDTDVCNEVINTSALAALKRYKNDTITADTETGLPVLSFMGNKLRTIGDKGYADYLFVEDDMSVDDFGIHLDFGYNFGYNTTIKDLIKTHIESNKRLYNGKDVVFDEKNGWVDYKFNKARDVEYDLLGLLDEIKKNLK